MSTPNPVLMEPLGIYPDGTEAYRDTDGTTRYLHPNHEWSTTEPALPEPVTSPPRVMQRGRSWNIEHKRVAVRPGQLHDDGETPDTGDRYRYVCNLCGNTGRWVRNGNDADGDTHLHRVHGVGE